METNLVTFKEQFLNKLLPYLWPKSVIIVDNTHYKSIVFDKFRVAIKRKSHTVVWLYIRMCYLL